MNRILEKSINELEKNKRTERPKFNSYAVQKTYELMDKKLHLFEPEDFRIMISQGFGLKYLVPLVLEILEKEPLIEANFYEGDLLYVTCVINKGFWDEYPILKNQLVKLFTDGLINYDILSEKTQKKLYTAFEELTE